MKIINISLVTLAFIFSAYSTAATVSVDWVSPEKYQDIDAGGSGKNKFKTKLFNELESVFNKEAKELPENYKLEISMLDLDLAGVVDHSQGVMARRVISDGDFPRVIFYMILRDEKGNIVLQGKQSLREKKLKHNRFRMQGSQSDFFMEKAVIEKWFKQALLPAIAKG